jgi:cytoskeletal protein RodZ
MSPTAGSGTEGLGDTLRAAREAKRLSLDELNRLTRIQTHYIEAIEEERFTDLPPPPYSQIFLRAYARAVGLPTRDVLDRYLAMTGEAPARRETLLWEESGETQEPAKVTKKRALGVWIALGLAIALALGIAGYFVWVILSG